MTVLSLVIPVFNEENTLENIVKKVFEIEKEQYALENNISIEAILVDDCSTDNSAEIIKKLPKIIRKSKLVFIKLIREKVLR